MLNMSILVKNGYKMVKYGYEMIVFNKLESFMRISVLEKPITEHI